LNEAGGKYIYAGKSRKQQIRLYKADLASAIYHLLELRPLVETGIIHLTPTNLHRQVREPGAIYAEDFYSAEGQLPGIEQKPLPEEVDRYCEGNLLIFPGEIKGGEIVPVTSKRILVSSADSFTTDKICFRFSSDPRYWSVHLATTSVNDEEHISMLYRTVGNAKVDERIFRNWVAGKRTEIIHKRLNTLQDDLKLAFASGAQFITNLPVSRDLAILRLDATDEVKNKGENVLTALLNFQLPFIDNASLTSIAKARQNEVAFIEFVSTLEKTFGEIAVLPRDDNVVRRFFWKELDRR
jgi:hypothetical protein